jgi:site-specific recombinase XerD
VDAALLVLKSMGLSLDDLTAAPSSRPPVPTFAEYVPVVAATVTPGTLRAYRPYWRRTVEQWGGRHLDEPTPSEIKQLVAYVKANTVPRRNSRGGHNAAENLISALRCLYQRAVDDGLIDEKDNPARKVAKGRRLPSTRRALDDARLAEINKVAATTGDDPELEALILRLHTETACRRGGALAIRPQDLDAEQCLVLLREKGETFRWQPVSPTLMAALVQHAEERHAPSNSAVLAGKLPGAIGRVATARLVPDDRNASCSSTRPRRSRSGSAEEVRAGRALHPAAKGVVTWPDNANLTE